MTMKNTLLQPEGWVTPKGYANGVAARGTMVFTGGQIGWNAQQQFESDDFIAQTKQTLLNVRAVLEAGGAGPEHLVRLTWYVTDRNEYNSRLKELGAVSRDPLYAREGVYRDHHDQLEYELTVRPGGVGR